MADRRQIEAMAKKKEQEIEGLETQIKEARIYLQALQDVLKRFPREAGDSDDADSALRPGSMVAQARDALLKRRTPMHVEQILADLGKEPSRKNKTALGSSISAYVRKGLIFTRTAPNTFGLVEPSRHHESGPEPPADFGLEKPQKDDDEPPF